MNSINIGKYNEADVMQQIEDMLEKRKDEKDLCRETTLYNMCDNMLSDLDQLKRGIMVVNSQTDETTASNSKR